MRRRRGRRGTRPEACRGGRGQPRGRRREPAAHGGGGARPPLTPSSPALPAAGALVFDPASITVAKGEEIKFVNNAGFPHNVVFDEDDVPVSAPTVPQCMLCLLPCRVRSLARRQSMADGRRCAAPARRPCLRPAVPLQRPCLPRAASRAATCRRTAARAACGTRGASLPPPARRLAAATCCSHTPGGMNAGAISPLTEPIPPRTAVPRRPA